MSSSDMNQQQKQLHSERERLNSAIEEQRRTEAEFYEEGEELDNDKAARMQEHSGNQAIQDLIDRLNDVENDITDLEQQEEEQEAFDEEQEVDVDETFQPKGNDGGGAGSTGNPWNQEFFYGGDDEPIQIRRKRKRKRRSTDFQMETEAQEDESSRTEQVDLMNLLLPVPVQGERRGDSRYKAVELALQQVGALIGHSLDPQQISKRKGVSDPIRLPVEIGRFLETHATQELAQSLGEISGGPSAGLVSPQGGFSTAVARIASLAICAEVAQGDHRQTDPAVSLSLHYDAWEECSDVANQLSTKGQLHAPKIAEFLIGSLPGGDENAPLPHPNVLGGAALKKILPTEIPFLKPSLIKPKISLPEEDELLALIDETIAEFTDGSDPYAPPKPPIIDLEMLQPALQSANQLLTALGRSQVEFAAAAVAVYKVEPKANIKSILNHCDSVLRRIARGVVSSGQLLEKLQGHPTYSVEAQLEHCLTTLTDCHDALKALRTWSLSTFAASVEEEVV